MPSSSPPQAVLSADEHAALVWYGTGLGWPPPVPAAVAALERRGLVKRRKGWSPPFFLTDDGRVALVAVLPGDTDG